MKNSSILIGVIPLLVACQYNKPKSRDILSPDTSSSPYIVKQIKHWQVGTDSTNSIKMLKLLKGFERLDTAMMSVDMADTVIFFLDGYRFDGHKKHLLEQMEFEFNRMTSFKITVYEVVPLINDKEESVNLWYEQINITKEGKIDTVYLYNKVKFSKGKVVELLEYIQHPAHVIH
ncbi:hypothetical protein QWY86_16695 [Pedobacter aquatilis]|uniref:hypothetical protein n=1 Tax=Pedobacter aquatilis TaxID=351343 RepID=UPI0025B3FCAF|nr:hypothetical protein [Pedobacter aquatilis]MDN3588323.1 hypothetical protein [Pedobacter aquatilis]